MQHLKYHCTVHLGYNKITNFEKCCYTDRSRWLCLFHRTYAHSRHMMIADSDPMMTRMPVASSDMPPISKYLVTRCKKVTILWYGVRSIPPSWEFEAAVVVAAAERPNKSVKPWLSPDFFPERYFVAQNSRGRFMTCSITGEVWYGIHKHEGTQIIEFLLYLTQSHNEEILPLVQMFQLQIAFKTSTNRMLSILKRSQISD